MSRFLRLLLVLAAALLASRNASVAAASVRWMGFVKEGEKRKQRRKRRK